MAGTTKCGLAIFVIYLTWNQVLADGGVTQTSRGFFTQSNIRLAGSVISELKEVGSVLRCSALCCRTGSCRSFNYDRTGRYCQLNRETKQTKPGNVLEDPRYSYYEMENLRSQVLTAGINAEQTPEEPNGTTAEPTIEDPQTYMSNVGSTDMYVVGNGKKFFF